MTSKGIPRLEPDGMHARVVRGPAPKSQRPREYRTNAQRSVAEPWRANGYGSEYRRARVRCIERARGRCEACGRTVATLGADGRWRMRGGEVHHVVPLAEGGDATRLALLCVSCHRKADAALRRMRADAR